MSDKKKYDGSTKFARRVWSASTIAQSSHHKYEVRSTLVRLCIKYFGFHLILFSWRHIFVLLIPPSGHQATITYRITLYMPTKRIPFCTPHSRKVIQRKLRDWSYVRALILTTRTELLLTDRLLALAPNRRRQCSRCRCDWLMIIIIIGYWEDSTMGSRFGAHQKKYLGSKKYGNPSWNAQIH